MPAHLGGLRQVDLCWVPGQSGLLSETLSWRSKLNWSWMACDETQGCHLQLLPTTWSLPGASVTPSTTVTYDTSPPSGFSCLQLSPSPSSLPQLQLPHLQLSPTTSSLSWASVSTPKAASWFSSTWAAVLWLWVPWCRVITLYRASLALLCILYLVFFQLNPWSLSSGSVQAMSTLTPFCTWGALGRDTEHREANSSSVWVKSTTIYESLRDTFFPFPHSFI